jgi:hypothetical protein
MKTRRRNGLPGRRRWRDSRRAAASDQSVGTAVRQPRRRWGYRDGGAVGFGPSLSGRWQGGQGVGGAVGAAQVKVGTRTRRGHDNTFMARRAHGVGAWQPRGDGALMSGPGAERKRLTGGTLRQRFFELKFTLGRK